VDAYWAAAAKIERDPAAFSEPEMSATLRKVAGDEVVAANVGTYLDLKKRGFRFEGSRKALTTEVSEPATKSYGMEINVTRCVDQRGIRVVDKTGTEVSASVLGYEIPAFNLRQYTVVKTKNDKTLRVYGLGYAEGACGA
jgi:hypothetical protein